MDLAIISFQAKQVVEMLKVIPTFGKENMVKLLASIEILENMTQNIDSGAYSEGQDDPVE